MLNNTAVVFGNSTIIEVQSVNDSFEFISLKFRNNVSDLMMNESVIINRIHYKCLIYLNGKFDLLDILNFIISLTIN